jgi:hypothetical protein
MEEGKIHMVARATDAALVRGQTIVAPLLFSLNNLLLCCVCVA